MARLLDLKVMIHLRAATLDDVALLRRWDEEPHVVASDPNDDWEWEIELGRNPDWREQLIAEIDGRPAGFVQIIDPAREESRYWGDMPANLRAVDPWIGDESDCGLARCFADPEVWAVLIDPLAANTRAPLLRTAGLPLRRAPALRHRRLLRLPAR